MVKCVYRPYVCWLVICRIPISVTSQEKFNLNCGDPPYPELTNDGVNFASLPAQVGSQSSAVKVVNQLRPICMFV